MLYVNIFYIVYMLFHFFLFNFRHITSDSYKKNITVY